MTFGIGDLKNSIDLTRKAIEERVNADQVTTIVNTAEQVRSFLDSCPKDFSEQILIAAKGIGNISQELIEEAVLDKFTQMLSNVNCLYDFFQTHSFLKKLIAFSSVAMTGYSILIPVLTCAAEYSRKKENKDFYHAIKQHFNHINVELMQQTKFLSGLYLLNYINSSHQTTGISLDDKKRLDCLAAEARRNIDSIPPLDRNLCENFAQSLVDCFYINAEIDPFDCIQEHLDSDFILALDPKKIEKNGNFLPKVDITQLNYAVVKKKYEHVDWVVKKAVDELIQKRGGDRLIVDCKIKNYNSEQVLKKCINFYKNPLSNLSHFINYTMSYGGIVDGTPESVCNVIANRAFVEFCKYAHTNITSISIHDSIALGALDAADIHQAIISEPSSVITGFFPALFSSLPLQAMNEICQNPVRAMASSLYLFFPKSNHQEAVDNAKAGLSTDISMDSLTQKSNFQGP